MATSTDSAPTTLDHHPAVSGGVPARELWLFLLAIVVIAVHVVDDNYLQPQPGTSAGDHLVTVGSAGVQSALELGHGWRQDKDGDEILAHCRLQLLGSLPVDVEKDVAPRFQSGFHRRLGRPVMMPEYRSPFHELAVRNHLVKLRIVDEMIVHIVALARPFGTRRGAHRHGHFRIRCQQHSRDGRLAGTGRGREDNQEAPAPACVQLVDDFHGRTCPHGGARVKPAMVQCTKNA